MKKMRVFFLLFACFFLSKLANSNPKVLIGCALNETPEVVEKWLECLESLESGSYRKAYCLIDVGCTEETSSLLKTFCAQQQDAQLLKSSSTPRAHQTGK